MDGTDDTILKVLNGSQNGVEVALEPGDYTIGGGPEDDLRLTDVALEPGHARLRVTASSMQVAAGAGRVRSSTGLDLEPDAGEEPDGEWHDIDQLDVLTLGTTRVALGKAGANWAALLAADAEGLDAPASADRKGARKAGRKGRDRKGSREEERQPRSRRLAVPVAALIALLGLGAATVSGRDVDLGRLIPGREASDEQMVRAALDAFPFGRPIEVTAEVDGTVYARGFTDTLAERRALRDAVRTTGVPARVRLWVREVLANEVEALIDARDLPVGYELTDTGEVVLTGTVLNAARVRDLASLITEQVVGVRSVAPRVRTAETVLDEVGDLAARSNLGGAVLFRLDATDPDAPLIEATGTLRNDRIDAWVGFLRAYAERVAASVPLRSFVGIEGRTVLVGGEGGTTVSRPVPLTIDSGGLRSGGASVPLAMLDDGDGGNEMFERAVLAAVPGLGAPDEGGAADGVAAGDAPDDVPAEIVASGAPDVPDDAAADASKDDASPAATADAATGGDGSTADVPATAERAAVDAPSPSTPPAASPPSSIELVLLGRAAGRDGAPGASGRDGTDGSDGAGGLPGTDGARGAAGRDGARGVAGVDGTDGADGRNGTRRGNADVADGATRAQGRRAQGTPGEGTRGEGTERSDTAGGGRANAGGSPIASTSPSTSPFPARSTGSGEAAMDLDPERRALDPADPASRARVRVVGGAGSLEAGSPPDRAEGAGTALAASDAAPTDPPTAASADIDYGTSVLALGTNAPEARRAFRTLAEATSVLLDMDEAGTLDALLGPEDAPAMDAAIELLSPAVTRTVRRAGAPVPARAGPLPATPERSADAACWSGARVSPDMMPPILFWLDLLSVTEEIALEDLIMANRGLILEVALSPQRSRGCLERMGGELAALGEASVYLSEAARNPRFIAFLTRGLEGFDIDVVGAKLSGDRYVQLATGGNLGEGAAPTAASRITSIGELGLLLRVKDGYRASVYPEQMGWRLQ